MSIPRFTLTGLACVVGLLACSAAPALAAAPAVQSESVSSVTPYEAHLEATVNAGEEPAGKTTECHFQYGKTSVSEHEKECEQGAPPGTLEGGEQGVSLNVAVPEPGTPLTPGTLYHYRVVLRNATGEVKGTGNPAEEEFTTLTLEKPTVESENASGVNSTGATLEAQIDPDYQKTTYTFEYATNKALTGAKTLTGTVEGPPGQTASAPTGATLQPGEIYYYRVAAKNATGTMTYPTVQSFTTVPTPFTEPPTPNSGISATFDGHFTLDPVPTKWSFDYNLGNTAECVGESSTPTLEAGSGTSLVQEQWTVPSPESEPPGSYAATPPLQPNKEYTVCFVTSNAYGSQVGPPEHFKTPTAPPTIGSERAYGLSASGVKLEAKIDPSLQETTYFVEYATSQAKLENEEGTKVEGTPPAPPLPAELKELPISVNVDVAPEAGKIYYYRVVAENESTTIEGKPATGEIKSYALPFVTAGEAQAVTATTATLPGTVNPEEVETTYHYEYVYQAGYEAALKQGGNPYAYGGGVTPEAKVEPADDTAHAVKELLSSLAPGTTFHYALVAKNADGATVVSPDQTFTTAPAEPESGEPVTPTSAESTPPQAALPATFPSIPYTPIAQLDATEAKEGKAVNPPSTKSLTNAQKLSKALKACKRQKSTKRAHCEKAAKKRYGAVKKAKRGRR